MLVEKDKVREALIKKATGYQGDEVVEEYAINENGEAVLSKRKVTKKYYPADISSIKVLLAEFAVSEEEEIEKLSNEQLEEEREKLIKLLNEEENEASSNEEGKGE